MCPPPYSGQFMDPPEVISMKSMPPETSTGTGDRCVLPFPSCPSALSPQQNALPFEATTQVFPVLAEIEVNGVGSSTISKSVGESQQVKKPIKRTAANQRRQDWMEVQMALLKIDPSES